MLALGGCHSGGPAAPPRIQLSSEPVTLDPSTAEDGLSLQILQNTQEGLMGYNPQGELELRLAESYRVTEGGKNYEFRLQPGREWSDGVAIEAAQFATAFSRFRAPGTASKMAALFADLEDVRIVGQTITFRLRRPIAYFPHLLTLPVTAPLRADILAAHHGQWPETGPGTGPYRIESHLRDQKYELIRNEHYVGPAGATALSPRIELLVIGEESTAANLFDQGKLDILTRIPAFDLKRYPQAESHPFLATYYIAFNTRQPPFNDRRLRQAVAGAVDKAGVAAALGTSEKPALSWIPPGLEGFLPYHDVSGEEPFRSAVAAEKIRLREQPLSPITATFDSSGRNATIMEKIQADLRRVLGMNIRLSALEWKSYVKSLSTAPAAIYRFGWLSPILDPVPHLQVFTGGNANNYTGWRNPEYDRLVEEIEALSPGPPRTARILAAERILTTDEAVVVPLYHYVLNQVTSPRLRGYQVSPFGVIRFEALSIKPPEKSP